MTDARPTRRAVLSAGGLLAVAACTGGNKPAPRRPPDPDTRIKADVVTGVRYLASLYAATMQRHPTLRGPLGRLAAEHAAHLTALGEEPSPTGTPAPSTSTPSSSPPAVPPTPDAARAALAAAERQSAGQRLEQLTAASPGLARLVAAIGACEAAHAALLGAPA
jgi:hypothetical protein